MFNNTHATNRPELLQVHALVPFIRSISASRADMFASEIGQAPPLKHSEIRRLQTGMEREFGKYTDMIQMPTNASVIKVLNKQSPYGMMGQTVTTATTVFYRCTETGQYGCVHIPVHSQNHQQFGFDFKRSKVMRSLRQGDNIAKDTILACSPSLDEHGNYKYGINGRIAFMSIPEVIQDGAVISESFAKKAQFRGYGTRVMSIGNETVGLNLFGKDGEYKMFPDVGDKIPMNDLIFATREIDPLLAPVQMSSRFLSQVEDTDRRTYGKALATVIDVEVIYGHPQKRTIPNGMDGQLTRYHQAQKLYYQEVLTLFNRICAEQGTRTPAITSEFHNLVVKAKSRTFDLAEERSKRDSRGMASNRHIPSLTFTNAGAPLNEYTVIITYAYDLLPTVSYKMADDSGGKAVIVQIWPDENMPLDALGFRADVIMDGGSIVNRLNPSRGYEHYITASLMATRLKLIEWYKAGRIDEAVEDVKKLYSILSPRFRELLDKVDAREHVKTIVEDNFHVWLPTDNPVDYVKVVQELEKHYPPCKAPVTYISSNGVKVTTEQPVMIGEQYFIFLEKIGDDYSAVASPVLQHQGIPGKLTRADKNASPGRPQAIRGLGETENRIVVSLVDRMMSSDMLDMANSPQTHKWVNRQLLTHPTPTNIECILDRNIVPRGNNRIIQHVNSTLMAGGFEFVYLEANDQ